MPWCKRYTDTELDFVQEALDQGVGRQELAQFFGITPAAIASLLTRYSLRPHKSLVDVETLGRKYGLLSVRQKEALVQQELDKSA